MRWEGHSLGLSGGRRWHLGVERGKMQEGIDARAMKEKREGSVECNREGAEDVRMSHLCWRA